MVIDRDKSLIVTVVRKGWGDQVIDASCKAGAEGGTVICGRGVGIHEKQKLFGLAIEPEKEVVLTLVSQDKAEEILQKIAEAVELDKPGHGMSFVIPVEKVIGVAHLLDDKGCA